MSRTSSDFQILESILLSPQSEYFLLSWHLERLQKTCRHFGFPFLLHELTNALEETRVQVRASQAYKTRLLLGCDGSFSIDLTALETGPEICAQRLPVVGLSSIAIDPSDPFLYHKTTKRELYDHEFNEGRQKSGYFDVIFRNVHGHLTEGSRSNIFIEKNQELLTPPVASGILSGIMRQYLLRFSNLKCREFPLEVSDLLSAEKIFLVNSVRGIVEVRLDEDVVNR